MVSLLFRPSQTIYFMAREIINTAVVPPPFLAFKSTIQPCESDNCRTIARPKPLPPVLLPRDCSKR